MGKDGMPTSNFGWDCMKLGGGSQERTQMLSKPGNAPNVHPGFSNSLADLPRLTVFLPYTIRFLPKIDPGAF